MGKLNRILLTADDAVHQINWLFGFRSGFQKLGVDALTCWPHPDPRQLNTIYENFKPDAIFEINRSKD